MFHAQARLTARSGVSLDTMMRRYFAGYVLLGDFLMREADRCSLHGLALQCIMRDTAVVFDRVVTTMAEEYQRELQGRYSSPEARLAARVRALLSGEILDAAEIDYPFQEWHLGALADGVGADDALKELAQGLDRRLLLIRADEDITWAWFGGRRPVDPETLEEVLASCCSKDLNLALGDPGRGIAGWRLTHRQAQAVLPVARRTGGGWVRYADSALLASFLQDNLLIDSLQERFLAPLASERDGGEVATGDAACLLHLRSQRLIGGCPARRQSPYGHEPASRRRREDRPLADLRGRRDRSRPAPARAYALRWLRKRVRRSAPAARGGAAPRGQGRAARASVGRRPRRRRPSPAPPFPAGACARSRPGALPVPERVDKRTQPQLPILVQDRLDLGIPAATPAEDRHICGGMLLNEVEKVLEGGVEAARKGEVGVGCGQLPELLLAAAKRRHDEILLGRK